jgi:(S)-2-hydroxyglutarate dehydrogenase
MTAEGPPGAADLVVVGAGIVGLAAARELQSRHPGLSVVVLEREHEIATQQTGRTNNSGVAHAGIYYAPGSLKARLCVEGLERLAEYCAARGIAFERCGKVVVALERHELPALDELERRARANGVAGVRRIGPEELRELEPHAAGIAALHSPATAIVDFAAVANALADDVRAAGGQIVTGCEVLGVERSDGGVGARHARGETQARLAVGCAGAWSDRLAEAAGAPADPRIVGFRGSYLTLRAEARGLVRGLIYPVPDPRLPFLGVHLTRRIDGEVLLGPSALLVPSRRALAWPGTWRLAARFWRTGVTELHLAAARRAFVAACARYVPALDMADVADGPSGVRAQAVGRDGTLVDDFVVHEAGGALHVRNAPSPAATSSLALAELIADRASNLLG